MLIAVLAAMLVQDVDPSGRYQIDASPGCTVRLQASLPGLPEAFVEGDAQSGFAFATPGCPLGLEDLSLWRFDRQTQTLTLVDGAGDTLLTATRDNRDWQAQDEGGVLLRLTRD